MAIRVLVADDQTMFREGLRTILEIEQDLQVVGLAQDGLDAVDQAKALRPDLVLMDIRMPRMDGVEATRRIRTSLSDTQVIILSTYDDDEFIFEALRAGAAGYLLKDFPTEELIKAIRTVHHGGGTLIPPPIAAKLVGGLARRAEEQSPEPLTEREREILGLVASGLANREIADRLHLSEGTVKNYISRIYAKLNARDRTQAALYAIEHGIVGEGKDSRS